MDSPGEILRLCRLCLVKDCVNIPIFEEEGDARQIFLKISSCLPVKVSREDRLPKKICDGCSEKLNSFYEFWSSSADAEKTLLSWVGQEEEEAEKKTEPSVPKPLAALVKEESEVADESHAQLVEEEEESTKDEEVEAPPAKRARRSAAVRAQKNITLESEDDDLDTGEPLTKMEEESADSDGEDKDPSYVEVPGTSADDEQAGPSGVGKDAVEAPYEIIRIKVEEPNSTGRFKCHLCSAKFHQRLDLVSHLRAHRQSEASITFKIDEKPSTAQSRICAECGKSYKNLQLHLAKHDKDRLKRPEKCPLCNEVTDDLRKHTLKSHADLRPFKCHLCEKAFKDRSTLTLHVKIHMGVRPYMCEVCGHNCLLKQQLKEHMRKHTGEKPYKCHLCPKCFSRSAGLVAHLRLHSGERPFVCEYCGMTFTRNKNLIVHYKHRHSI